MRAIVFRDSVIAGIALGSHLMSTPSLRIAVITTEYRPESHADVIVSRWLEPRPTDHNYGWGHPQTTIASMYVDQLPENDISIEKCRTYGIPKFETVAAALTLGGDELAVDAVLLIAEHGNYPLNEFQQKLYPRKELFDQVIEIFRRSNKVVPIFLDKHLSWNTDWIHQMYWQIREMEIPFFGGSSLPHNPFCPPVPVPGACKEVVAIYWNSLEAYLFHSLEVVQHVFERLQEGGKEVVSITAWQDEQAWQALDRGVLSLSLLHAAAQAVSPAAGAAMAQYIEERGTPLYVFQILYRDGLKETHLMQKDIIRKWSLAFVDEQDGKLHASYVESQGKEEFFPHFARLNRQIEDFFLTRKSPVSLERLYFTSMATALCLQALKHQGQAIAAPLLKVPVPIRPQATKV